MDTTEERPRRKSKIRINLEIAGIIATILATFGGAIIWAFQNVSDAAAQRAILPMKLERLEKSNSEHETRLTTVEQKAVISEEDRKQLHREIAEGREAFTEQIRALASDLSKRLDRLDDRTERIGDRVGVSRQVTPDPGR